MQQQTDTMATLPATVEPPSHALLAKLLDRYEARCAELEIKPADDRLGMEMTLYYVKLANPAVDLERLLAFPSFDFMHDMAGMRQHVDTDFSRCGYLRNHFLPRCAGV